MSRLFVMLLILLSDLAWAQLPSVVWAGGTGDVGMDNGQVIALDAAGNIVMTGYFTSPVITFGSTTLTNADSLGTADFFVAKYSSNGSVLWAQRIGGSSNEYGYGVATDAAGNIVVSGSFTSSTITLGNITLINANPAGTSSDIFFAKYDASGNVLWAKSSGGINWDNGSQVATDKFGNVFVTGYYASSQITFGATTLNNSGIYDVFLAKYDAGGNFLWARSSVGSGSDIGNNVAVDPNGNVLIGGFFQGTSLGFGAATMTSAGNGDGFLAKYDPNGNVLWAKLMSGAAFDKVCAVFSDANGDMIVLGYYISSTITFGSTTLTNAGTGNLFLVKYDAAGNVLWARSAGGSVSEEAYGLTLDPSGNIFVTGSLTSPTVTFGTTTLTNTGVADFFLLKYDSAGNLIWATGAGGNSDEVGNSVCVDANGDILVAGFSTSPTITFGNTTLTNTGGLDLFLVKYTEAVTGLEVQTMTGTVSLYPNPFSSFLTVESGSAFSHASLRLENSLGQLVASVENVSGTKITIPRQQLPPGIYFVHLYENNRLLAREKVVVE